MYYGFFGTSNIWGFWLAVSYPVQDQTNLQNEIATSEDLFTQPTPVIANQRHEAHFKQAQKHSTLVGLLKKALPIAALGLVTWFVIMGFLNTKSIGDISVKSSGISNGMLIMEQPKMSGFNRDNRPYNLVASRAKQDLKNPDIINMENLQATVPMQADIYADIRAKIGTYDSDKEWLILSRDIEINSQDGTRILLNSAEIDLSKGKLISRHPVFVSTPTTQITADQVEVIDNGSIIIFKQKVRMTITLATESN